MWLHTIWFYSRFFCVVDAIVGFAFGLWMELWAGWPYVIWVVRFLVDGLPVGWLTHLSLCTRLAWVCLCTRVLNAWEKVSFHASSQLDPHVIISLPQHSALWSPKLFWNSWSRTSLAEILYLTNTHQELRPLSSGLLYVDEFKTWRSHSLRKTIWIILYHRELELCTVLYGE